MMSAWWSSRLDGWVRGYNSTLVPWCPFGSCRGSGRVGDCPLEALSEANCQKDRPPFLSIYRPFVRRQLCSHYHSPGFTRNLLDSISLDAQQNIEGHFARAKPQGNWKRSYLWLPLWEVQGGRWKKKCHVQWAKLAFHSAYHSTTVTKLHFPSENMLPGATSSLHLTLRNVGF